MVKAFINDVLKYSLVTQKLRASKEETQEESKINNQISFV